MIRPILAGLLAVLAATPAVAQTHQLMLMSRPLSGTAGRPLADLVEIKASNLDETQCRAWSLDLIGGTASPNPAPFVWRSGVCAARFAWTLASTAGSQELVAAMVPRTKGSPAAQILIQANASAVPRPTLAISLVPAKVKALPSTTVDQVMEATLTHGGIPCDSLSVSFTSTGDGEVKPASAPALSQGSCVARTLWKLPSHAWAAANSGISEPLLVAEVSGRGVTASATAVAELVEPTGGKFKNKSDWAYQSRDFEKPLTYVVTLDENEGRCSELKVAFQAQGEAAVVPAEVQGARIDATTCAFATRWKLAPISGEQVLRAGVTGFPETRARYVGIARAKPRLVTGLVWVENGMTPPADPADTTAARPKEQSFVPVFGVDVPLAAILRRNWLRQNPGLHKFRLTVATSFGDPGDNLFLGLNFTPLLAGIASEDAAITVLGGFRWQDGGNDRWWLGATIDLGSGLEKLLPGVVP